jgi:hypothetical protein
MRCTGHEAQRKGGASAGLSRQTGSFKRRRQRVSQGKVRLGALQRLTRLQSTADRVACANRGYSSASRPRTTAPARQLRPGLRSEEAEAAAEHARVWGTEPQEPQEPQEPGRHRLFAPGSRRRRSANGRLQHAARLGSGAAIELSGSPSHTTHTGVGGGVCSARCYSDPGMHVSCVSSLSSGSESDRSEERDSRKCGTFVRQQGLLASLLLRVEDSPEHFYGTDSDEVSEEDIAQSLEDSGLEDSGSEVERSRCAFLDDDALSDASPAPVAAVPARTGRGRAPRRLRSRSLKLGQTSGEASAEGPDCNVMQHMVSTDTRKASGECVTGNAPAALTAQSVDSRVVGNGARTVPQSAAEARGREVQVSGGVVAGTGGARAMLASAAAGEKLLQAQAGFLEVQQVVSAVERRRQRRELEEAKMCAVEPEIYEKVLATRRALAPFGWDKCAFVGAFFSFALFGLLLELVDVTLKSRC